jgi:DNA-binding XRE family transcriptional regulator
LRVAVPMTATSNQEPLTPPEPAATASVGREVVANGPKSATVGEDSSSSTPSTSPVVAVAAVEVKSEPESGPKGREEESAAKRSSKKGEGKDKGPVQPNNVRKLRQAAMMSKAELARRAGVSPLTIDRVEAGCPCRMDTKRKILEALGLSPSAREQVFGPDIDQG